MNTENALHDYFLKSKASMQEVDRQIGIREGSVCEIFNKISYPVGIRLLKVQEFLTRKGYRLEELEKLPEYLARIKSLIFDGKIVFDDDFLKKTKISRNSTFYQFLKTGRINRQSLDLILEILKETEERSSENKPERVDSKPPEISRSSIATNNVLVHLQYALMIIETEGSEFLRTSTKAERMKLREKLGQKLLFSATNTLSGLSSEKARELQQHQTP